MPVQGKRRGLMDKEKKEWTFEVRGSRAGEDSKAGQGKGVEEAAGEAGARAVPETFKVRRDEAFDDAEMHFDHPYSSAVPAQWSVPWSDLMMVMFILFAVLYTYSVSNRSLDDAFKLPNDEFVSARPETKLKEPTFELDPEDLFRATPENLPVYTPEEIYERTVKVVKDSDLKNIEVVLNDDRSVTLRIRGRMSFDLGSAGLREETRSFLDEVAGVLAPVKNEIRVAGHTDDFAVVDGSFASNWELSASRASAIVRYLVERGMAPELFTVVAHSKYRPVAPNTDDESRALNRRVEIVITKDAYNEGAGPGLKPGAADR